MHHHLLVAENTSHSPLTGEVFDFSGFVYGTACSVFLGTSVALHTDSLIMIYSLKHQSPDNDN